MEVSGQLHAPAALFSGKQTPEPVWTTWRRENSWPHRDSQFDPSVVQSVASRYTDYAIPAPALLHYTTFSQGSIAAVKRPQTNQTENNDLNYNLF
jgi:hypothetical protein